MWLLIRTLLLPPKKIAQRWPKWLQQTLLKLLRDVTRQTKSYDENSRYMGACCSGNSVSPFVCARNRDNVIWNGAPRCDIFWYFECSGATNYFVDCRQWRITKYARTIHRRICSTRARSSFLGVRDSFHRDDI